jgi:hypothetical protein
MPILNPEKPKRISLTMANTLFGAMSGVRPVNWGLLIHEVVGQAIPHIGRKPPTSPPSFVTSTGTTTASRRMRRTY